MIPNVFVDATNSCVGASVFRYDVGVQIDVIDSDAVDVAADFAVDALSDAGFHAMSTVAVKRFDALAAEPDGLVVDAAGVIVADAGRVFGAGALGLFGSAFDRGRAFDAADFRAAVVGEMEEESAWRTDVGFLFQFNDLRNWRKWGTEVFGLSLF